ncbi:naa20 [Nucleospora cyclopteri]
MITYQPMLPEDIFRLDFVNLDCFSENFTTEYYLNKMKENPSKFFCVKLYSNKQETINVENTIKQQITYENTPITNENTPITNENTQLSYNNMISIENTIYGYIFGTKTTKTLDCIVSNRNGDTNKVCRFLKRGQQMNALSVSPFCRRLGIGDFLVQLLIKESGNCDFIKLFVRKSNVNAIEFYRKKGFKVYRSILDYYSSPNEDAYEMIKSFGFITSRIKDIKSAYLGDDE